jgi:hypothetical protein
MSRQEEFTRLARQPSAGLLAEAWGFLVTTKKWWLFPVLVVLTLLAVLIMLSNTPAAPFLYTLF